MAAFEQIYSGLPGLDRILDYIRLGDNVVWSVSELEQFSFVIQPFAKQAIKDKRKLIYIRFAEHAPFLEVQPGLQIFQLHPQDGFEEFTMQVREIITNAGRDAFYVFDCLSELQEAWATDLMMGNFFYVTCPYLFELDTVAYFPVKRGMHSFDAMDRIRQTTQLLLDVYQGNDQIYIQPLKVWNRYSGTMFQPHLYAYETESFEPLLDSLNLSRFYSAVDADQSDKDQNLDHWDRYFSLMKQKFTRGKLNPEDCRKICSIMLTRNDKMAELLERHFLPQDYFSVRNRMIGTGMIGGKACGVLLSRKMVQTHLPELAKRLEPHDSYYVGSDVFYTYIVANDCWQIRVEQRKERDEFRVSAEFGKHLREGVFPANIKEQFRRMLDYFGQSPIIVRSSSFLEDGFGNAFAGKYESVFCVNAGTLEDRLEKFEEAVKTVYASTMDPSALEYRRNRNLLDCDEQMALLVQRVSGSWHDRFLMPTAAGVGYSYNAYKWLKDMDPKSGMLRLVLGLGTRAVDRTSQDYPRIVSLDRPQAQLWPTFAARHRYSQHQVDVLDMQQNKLCTIPLEQAEKYLPVWQRRILLSHDTEAEERLQQRGNPRDVLFGDCQGLINNAEFIDMMHQILSMLQEQYQYPVDIEFTVNTAKDGDFVVNLLQCRPLQVDAVKTVALPEKRDNQLIFELSGTSMGMSRIERIDLVVLVDPQKYYDYPYVKKTEPARLIGQLNQKYGGKGQNMLLIVPGRIGTSSPELGVPVVYADISRFCAICEVSYRAAGYMPELSYGSHMFQDLVEAHIFYGAIFEDIRTKVYQPDRMDAFLKEEYLDGMVKVFDLAEADARLYFDMMKGYALFQMNTPE